MAHPGGAHSRGAWDAPENLHLAGDAGAAGLETTGPACLLTSLVAAWWVWGQCGAPPGGGHPCGALACSPVEAKRCMVTSHHLSVSFLLLLWPAIPVPAAGCTRGGEGGKRVSEAPAWGVKTWTLGN